MGTRHTPLDRAEAARAEPERARRLKSRAAQGMAGEGTKLAHLRMRARASWGPL